MKFSASCSSLNMPMETMKRVIDTDQSGEDAVNRVARAVQHGGHGIRPFFPDKLL